MPLRNRALESLFRGGGAAARGPCRRARKLSPPERRELFGACGCSALSVLWEYARGKNDEQPSLSDAAPLRRATISKSRAADRGLMSFSRPWRQEEGRLRLFRRRSRAGKQARPRGSIFPRALNPKMINGLIFARWQCQWGILFFCHHLVPWIFGGGDLVVLGIFLCERRWFFPCAAESRRFF